LRIRPTVAPPSDGGVTLVGSTNIQFSLPIGYTLTRVL